MLLIYSNILYVFAHQQTKTFAILLLNQIWYRIQI